MDQWIGDQGPPNVAKAFKTCLLCDATFRNPPTENEKGFFSIWLQDLLNPSMVWIAL